MRIAAILYLVTLGAVVMLAVASAGARAGDRPCAQTNAPPRGCLHCGGRIPC